MAALLDPEAVTELGGNAMRLMFHPRGFRPHIVNWEPGAAALIQWLHRDVLSGFADAETRRLLEELLAYPGVPARWRTLDLDVSTAPFLPIEFRKGDLDAALLHHAHEPRHPARHHAAGAAHRVVLSGRRGDRAGDAAVECAMPRINESYLNLRSSYLFAEIRRRQEAFAAAHPDVRVIDLGVGDVTRPLPSAVIGAIHEAAEEMARPESFRGYGPYVGYEFLRSAIAAHDFAPRGVTLAPDEIFVSDGGKSDSANLQEIFAGDCVVALMDPVYPVYADSNVVAGRSGQGRRRRPLRRHGLSVRARRRTTFSPPCPIVAPISSISAIPTIPPARWRRGRRWRAGSRGRGPTTR